MDELLEFIIPALRRANRWLRHHVRGFRPGLSEDDVRTRDTLVASLTEHRGNVSEVARSMGRTRMQIHRWMRRFSIDPETYGIKLRSHAPLGGDTAANLALARAVLAGEAGEHRDIVVLNAAAGLVVAGVVDELGDGVTMAAEAIDNGAAAAVLEKLVAVSTAAAS